MNATWHSIADQMCSENDTDEETEDEESEICSKIPVLGSRKKKVGKAARQSKYIGVTWHSGSSKWRATRRNCKERVFDDEIEAALKSDEYVRENKLWKRSVELNFPEKLSVKEKQERNETLKKQSSTGFISVSRHHKGFRAHWYGIGVYGKTRHSKIEAAREVDEMYRKYCRENPWPPFDRSSLNFMNEEGDNEIEIIVKKEKSVSLQKKSKKKTLEEKKSKGLKREGTAMEVKPKRMKLAKEKQVLDEKISEIDKMILQSVEDEFDLEKQLAELRQKRNANVKLKRELLTKKSRLDGILEIVNNGGSDY